MLMTKPEAEYHADFLWPFDEDSIEEAGYEFANGKTEEYRLQWWEILKERLSRTPPQSNLKDLQSATNTAIEKAATRKGDFGAINWGDLSCITAERCEDEEGDTYCRVWIEEADPSNYEFQFFISGELQRAGFDHVFVETEW